MQGANEEPDVATKPVSYKRFHEDFGLRGIFCVFWGGQISAS